MIWRYLRKRLQISPKSGTLIVFSKTAVTIFFGFWPEVSTKYDLQFEWNLFFRKICYLEIFDLEIVKIWLFSYNLPVQSMYSCLFQQLRNGIKKTVNFMVLHPNHLSWEFLRFCKGVIVTVHFVSIVFKINYKVVAYLTHKHDTLNFLCACANDI